MRLVAKAGSTGRSIFLYARDAADEVAPRTGLSATSPGVRAAYVRDDGLRDRIALVHGTAGAWQPGALAEVDAELLPGIYQFGIPDDVLSEGASLAVIIVQAPRSVVEPVEIALVAYDPLDPVRMGMEALSPEARIAALHGAFPRLAASELDDAAASREPD